MLHANNVANVIALSFPLLVKTSHAMMIFLYKAILREGTGKVGPVVTDNGNMIVDAYFRNLRRPEIIHEKLKNVPGVIETGLFLGMADVAYVGRKDGHVDILRRS